MGETITEADVRLFTTLARFDAVYHGHFKSNRQKLAEFPALWAYARDLFQTPGFGDTIDFPQIKEHYYVVHKDINPTQVIPGGSGHVELADATRARGSRRVGRSATGRRPAPSLAGEEVPADHGPGGISPPLRACGRRIRRRRGFASVCRMTKPPLADVPIRSADELTSRWAALLDPPMFGARSLWLMWLGATGGWCRSSCRWTTSRRCPTRDAQGCAS